MYPRHRANGDKGDHDRAIADFNAAIRLDSKSAAAYYGRGVAYHRKRDLNNAIADYSEAIHPLSGPSLEHTTTGASPIGKGEVAQVKGRFRAGKQAWIPPTRTQGGGK